MTALTPATSPCHDLYLSVLPAVASMARRRFAWLPVTDREEAVAEAIATDYVACLSLMRRGRGDQVRTAGFVINAVRAVAGGRRVGNRQNVKDILSVLGRRRHGRRIMSFDADAGENPAHDGHWLRETIADRRTPVPDKVALHIDGERWLTALPPRDRRMIQALASGERASAVAKQFHLSPARLSQLRQAWAERWQQCVGLAA